MQSLSEETIGEPARSNPRSESFRANRGLDALGVMFVLLILVCPIVYSFRFESFLHPKEAALCLALCALAPLAAATRLSLRKGLAAFAPILAFVSVSLFLRVATFPAQAPSDAVTTATRWMLPLLAVMCASNLPGDEAWGRRLLDALFLSTVLVALLGIGQYAGVLAMLFPEFPGYDQRVYSVFGNQDLYGGYVAVGAALALGRLWNGPGRTAGACLGKRGVPAAATPAQTEICPSGIAERAARAVLNSHLCGSGEQERVGWISLAALGVLLFGLALSGCRSAWLAVVVGAASSLNGLWTAHDARRRSAGIVVVTCLAVFSALWLVPEATLGRLRATFGAHDEGAWIRPRLWRGALDMFCDTPIAGVGMGNYAYWSPAYLGERLANRTAPPPGYNERHADNAHSEPLQALCETGLAGVACLAWFLATLWRKRGPERSALAALLVFSCFNTVSISAPHLLAGFLLAGCLLLREDDGGEADSGFGFESPPNHKPQTANPIRCAVGIAFASLAVAVALFHLWAVVLPSQRLRTAQSASESGRPALALYERVTGYPWPSAAAHKGYAMALAAVGKRNAAYREFRKALNGLDTGDIYLALAVLASERGDDAEARRWAEGCLLRWPFNEDARVLAKMLRTGRGGL